MNNSKLGSIWRKWDLHIHSKYSQESSAKLEIIDIFKFAIEKKIEVISITDHSNVDSLDEIWSVWEKESVIVNNATIKISDHIDFLPGCELKTDKGKRGVHIVVVFPKNIKGSRVNKKFLEQQFLSKINCSRQDVIDQGDGDYSKGLFNIPVDFEKTSNIAKKSNGLIIVHAGGKTSGIEKEMEHAKDETNIYQIWNSLGAKKKDLMENFIDICELPNSSEKSLKEAKFYLETFNKPSILSSDSHSSYSSYDGNMFTWIKADPTFEGLKQIIYEPEGRVFIGEKPSVLDRVQSNKTKYIKTLKIDQKKHYNESHGVWFKDIEIELNSELVAIIGNKGSGKSAIADIIGLLGNTKNAGDKNENFSFLNDQKFRKRGFSENFVAELEWEDGAQSPQHLLSDEVDNAQVERIRYLPQNYFETLTNSLNGDSFEKTLRDVIFLNIPKPDRLGLSSFDDLEKMKKKNIEIDITKLKNDLEKIITSIVKLEKRNHPDNIKRLSNFIIEKTKELSEHDKTKPPKVNEPSKEPTIKGDNLVKKEQLDSLTELNKQYLRVSTEIDQKRNKLIILKQNEEKLNSITIEVQRFKELIDENKTQHSKELAKLGIIFDDIIKLTTDLSPITKKLAEVDRQIKSANLILSTKLQIESDLTFTNEQKEKFIAGSLINQMSEINASIKSIKDVLSKPEKDFQEYKEKLQKWEEKRKKIEGIETDPAVGTLIYYQNEKDFISTKLQVELQKLYDNRLNKAVEILNKKKEILDLYNSLKQSIDKQLSDRTDLSEKFKIEIDSGFILNNNFPEQFLQYINKVKSGTFRSATEMKVLDLYKDKVLTDNSDIQSVLNNIILSLQEDHSENIEKSKNKRNISDQIANVQAFYEYIFSLDYLIPMYDLQLDGKKLNELSPGERGALLLVFYLIIDKEEIPLLIDQPEDNLDNKSVFEILTHFIKIAKTKRQIIIVTHNPNLAVGADAEQIIYVEIEKMNKCRFVYEAGGIENPLLNNRIVEILEGTMPAFEKREIKYMKVQKVQ